MGGGGLCSMTKEVIMSAAFYARLLSILCSSEGIADSKRTLSMLWFCGDDIVTLIGEEILDAYEASL